MSNPRETWLKRKKHYTDNPTQASMRTEDQVASHIIKGIGYSPKAIYPLEKALGIQMEWESPVLAHVRAILDAVSKGAFSPRDNLPSDLVLDVRESKDPVKWIDQNADDIADDAVNHGIGTIVVMRCEKTKDVVAYVFVKDNATVPAWLLQPKSLLFDKKRELQIWCRKAKQLFYDMARYMNWELPEIEDQDERKEDPYVPVGFDAVHQ